MISRYTILYQISNKLFKKLIMVFLFISN